MLGLSDAVHFRRIVAGVSLIAAPLILLVGALAHPQGKDSAIAHLAVVAESPDRYYVAHAILLGGLALFLPAVLGIMHLLTERATALGHIGGGLAMVGLFGATAIVAVDGIAISQRANRRRTWKRWRPCLTASRSRLACVPSPSLARFRSCLAC
jgi:hypothetical protein